MIVLAKRPLTRAPSLGSGDGGQPNSLTDIDPISLYELQAIAEARQSFPAFRRYMHPDMIWGWWVQEISFELQQFYQDFVSGLRPKLVLMAPPQAGKSWMMTDFIAWLSCLNPDLKTIFASYSEALGVRTNLALQRMFISERLQRLAPDLRLGSQGSSWILNQSLIEFVERNGSFRNTTVDGAITGQSLDIGVIDDPIKGRAEAQSLTVRDKTWNWLTDDFFPRFSETAAMVIIATRYHMDDPIGRWLDRFPDTKALAYPAIAEHDEEFRLVGEPLFPEWKSLPFLLERRQVMTRGSWEAEYQQNPIIIGGGLFPVSKLAIIPQLEKQAVMASVRYVDKAATEAGGAYTAMVLMHAMRGHPGYVISDVRRGRWSAYEREQRLKQTAEIDRKNFPEVRIWVEVEPGSGGKESGENTIRNLAGFRVYGDRVTGDKELRAEPFAAQVQAGNVALIAGEWTQEYINELEQFPSGKYKDQVDASSGAFNHVVTSGPMIIDPALRAWAKIPAHPRMS